MISPSAIGEEQKLGIRRRAFLISGQVSVTFRASALAEGRRLNLLGFVESFDHGLRGLVEGGASELDAFFDWCVDNASSSSDMVPAVIDVTGEDTRPLPLFEEREARAGST